MGIMLLLRMHLFTQKRIDMKETEEDLAQEIINSINKALEPIVDRNMAKEDIESVKKAITEYLLGELTK